MFIYWFVCWFVCLLFIGHTTFVHFAALPPSTLRAAKPSRAAPRAAGKHAHSESMRAHAVQLLNKNPYADAFQKQNRTRAHAVVYVTAKIFKKREKENQHATSQVQFTVCLLLECYFSNRTESFSAQIEFAGPHGITENQATYLHCGGEARAKKRARPPATCRKASTAKTGADTGPEGCGSPAVFTPRNTATTR